MVWKKTGGLDLILPVLWKIRETYPNTKITLLIAEINKHHLIRDGVFYIRFCEHHDIELLDFLDFLPNWLRPFKGILRRLTKRAPVDGKSDNPLFDFLIYQLTKFLKQQIDYSQVISLVSSDVLFINDEWWDKLPQSLMDFIIKHHQKIFLVQHGPIILTSEKPVEMTQPVMLRENRIQGDNGVEVVFHQSWFETPDGVGIYRHVINRETLLGPYEVKQIPLSYMGIGLASSIELERLTYVGFPGFDTDWFEYVDSLVNNHPSFSNIIPPKRKKLRCMLLTREVVNIGDTGRKSTPSDFQFILQTLQSHVQNQYDTEIIIKPHPKQNHEKLKQSLKMMGIKDFSIVADALYVVLPTIDFAITMQSSGAYYPLTSGIPCIHIIKGEHGKRSYLFNYMEHNLQRVITNLDDLPRVCQTLIEDLTSGKAIPNDVEHMRKFYPDGAIQLIMEQIKPWLKS